MRPHSPTPQHSTSESTHITSCPFSRVSSTFTTDHSSASIVALLLGTDIYLDTLTSDDTSVLVANVGGEMECSSSCGAGTYGDCIQVMPHGCKCVSAEHVHRQIGDCWSCTSTCFPCPVGTYLGVSGGVQESDCITCPRGTANNVTGAFECEQCSAGTDHIDTHPYGHFDLISAHHAGTYATESRLPDSTNNGMG